MLMAEREYRMKENGSQGSEMVERIYMMVIAPNRPAYPERMWAQREWKSRCGTKQWQVEFYQQSTQNCSRRTGIQQGVCVLHASMKQQGVCVCCTPVCLIPQGVCVRCTPVCLIPQGMCTVHASMSDTTRCARAGSQYVWYHKVCTRCTPVCLITRGKKGRTQVALSNPHQFKDEETDS